MATKAFKKLPKKAQRAAFAEMDDSGTRRNGIPIKKLKDAGKTLDRNTRKALDPHRLPAGANVATKEQVAKRKESLKMMSGFTGSKLSGGNAAKTLLKSLKK